MTLIKQLYLLSVKSIIRNSPWATKLIVIIFSFIMLVNMLNFGMNLDRIIEKVYPDQLAVLIVNRYMIYYFLFVFIMRLFLQRFGMADIKSFFLQNISKRYIQHFVLIKSFLNYFTFSILVLIVPFALSSIVVTHSMLHALFWIVLLLVWELIIDLLLILIQQSIDYRIMKLVLGIFMLGFVVHSLWGGGIPLQSISLSLFQDSLNNSQLIFFPLFLLILLYILNYSLLNKMMRLDSVNMNQISVQKRSIFDMLSLGGEDIHFIRLHLKQIFRYKRSKVGFFYNLVSYVMAGVFIFSYALKETDKPFMAFFIQLLFVMLVYMSVLQSYSNFFFAWDSNQIDSIHTLNLSVEKFYHTRIKVVILLLLICYPVTLVFQLYHSNMALISLTGLLMNIGIIQFIYILLSFFHFKKINVHQPVYQNFDGLSIPQFIFTFVFYIFVMVLAAIFSKQHVYAFLTLGFIGIAGMFFYKHWLSVIMKKYKKDKYYILDVLRY